MNAGLVALLTECVFSWRHLPLHMRDFCRAGRHEFHRFPAPIRHCFVVEIIEHPLAVILLHDRLVPSPDRRAVPFPRFSSDGRLVG